MGKLLRQKDILLLTLAGFGDLIAEARDPIGLVSLCYQNVYGFVPGKYKRQNFYQTTRRCLKTGDIEKVIKNDEVYFRLTSFGKERLKRDFPIISLSKKWNKKWVLIIFDVEEASRQVRNRLRNKLKSLGFGLLQKSVWITPLPIAGDMIEFIESNSLSKYAFVLEVSHLLLGDPLELARKVWNLDEQEEKALKIKERMEEIINKKNSYITTSDDRRNKRYVKRLESGIRGLKREELELKLSLPFLTKELLPVALEDLLKASFRGENLTL